MTAPAAGPVQAPGRVLASMNVDGSRRRIRPRPSPGRWWRIRRAVAWGLIALFVALPYVRIGGRPAVLLDLPRREFTLFGATFLASDGVVFMLAFVGALVAVLAFTALFGRVWCGWACPQTVYLEFVYRPLERLFEGGRIRSMVMDTTPGLHPRRVFKNLAYLAVSALLAHVFLAYFVGVDQLAVWVRRSPVEHPTSFLVMLGTAALVFFDFAWFREQTCLVACPYGRLQSVLLDRRSLIVGYDPGRGEPRMKGRKGRPARAGDCIDCSLCVITCPTGIDIREGLQMECIHCTQCMDACDSVMAKIGRPPGLIRYTSREELAGRARRLLRPRVVLYPLALAVAVGALAIHLGTRGEAEVTLLRGQGAPYTVAADGRVTNLIRIKVANRGRADRAYRIALEGVPGATLLAPVNPIPVAGGKALETGVFVTVPREALGPAGERGVRFHLSDDAGFDRSFDYRLVGPEGPDGARP